MGPITQELLEAISHARAEGKEVVGITLFATAWGDLHKESSGQIAQDGVQRTFAGIPMKPSERDPISPPFVLETRPKESLTDSEMLELARKAMNAATSSSRQQDTGSAGFTLVASEWNPLRNYDDALALAKVLDIDFRQPKFLPTAEDLVPGSFPAEPNLHLPACRAIVLAAVDIGQKLK